MIADHGKANQQLDELAQAAKVPQPGDADEQHKAMLQYLEKLSGRDFDLAYIRGQVMSIRWRRSSSNGKSVRVSLQLRAFAAQVLPTVLRHLERRRSRLSWQRPLPSTPPQAREGPNENQLWRAEPCDVRELASTGANRIFQRRETGEAARC
jgi:Domain of unknown function (DUF4142)